MKATNISSAVELITAVIQEYGVVPKQIVVSRRDWNALASRYAPRSFEVDAEGRTLLRFGTVVIFEPAPDAAGVLDISYRDWLS